MYLRCVCMCVVCGPTPQMTLLPEKCNCTLLLKEHIHTKTMIPKCQRWSHYIQRYNDFDAKIYWFRVKLIQTSTPYRQEICPYNFIKMVTSSTRIGLYRENAIAVRVIDRSAYDATSRVSSAKKLVSTQRLLHLLPASLRCCALIS